MSSEEKDLTIGEESVAALSLEQTGIDDDAVSTVESDSDRIDHICAVCGMIWLMSIMDCCFTWFFPWEVRYVIGSLFVFYATFVLSKDNGVNSSKQGRTLSLILSVLVFYMVVREFQVLYLPFKFGPLFCILLWRSSALLKFYEAFRKFIIFYAVLSVLVEVLVLSKAIVHLPYMILPPQDNVQEALEYVNYFFGIFSIQATDLGLSFYRASGPLREGGHFALFIGFVYFADKVFFNKRNFWVILCGVLTLSPNFLIAIFITEGFLAIKKRKFIKPILSLFFFVFVVILAFLASPQSIKDEIIGVILERTLESSIENMGNDGLMALIDGRAGAFGVSDYDAFLKKDLYTRLMGTRLPELNVMSDYRCLIMLFGYIGTTLILICIVAFSIGRERNVLGLGLFALGMLIFIHRAWMYQNVYHWAIMFLITNASIAYMEKPTSLKEDFEAP